MHVYRKTLANIMSQGRKKKAGVVLNETGCLYVLTIVVNLVVIAITISITIVIPVIANTGPA